MFLVRHKKDGLYWRNLGYHSKWRKRLWQESSEGIKPFLTKSGARNAMRPYCYVRTEPWTDHDGKQYPRSVYKPERFDEQFEIVEVKVTLASRTCEVDDCECPALDEYLVGDDMLWLCLLHRNTIWPNMAQDA